MKWYRRKYFSVYFGFTLPVITSPTVHTDLSSRTGIMGPFETAVPRDSFLPHFKNKIKAVEG
jgi:hypothetical protein